MAEALKYLAPIVMGLVAIVLLLGLLNMMRAGSSNRSQMLMRWRVVLQFVAVLLLVGAVYFSR